MTQVKPSFEERVANECATLDELSETMSQLRVHWDIRPEEQSPFKARVRRRTFGDVIFAEMEVGACSGGRGRYQISSAKDEYICLTYFPKGRQVFSQRSEDTHIRGNELFVWDGLNPAEFVCPVPTAGETIMFPRSMVSQRIGNKRNIVGRKASYDQGTTKLLASHCHLLHQTIETIPEHIRRDVIYSTLDLLLSCTESSEYGSKTSYKQKLWDRIQEYVRAEIENENLSVNLVSQTFGFSTRYLQTLFAENKTTFLEFVRQERLDHAARALASPWFASSNITEIAHRFGFCDLSHFSRTFRKRYKLSPVAYRAAASNGLLSPLGSH